jgi:glutathione S-transferase
MLHLSLRRASLIALCFVLPSAAFADAKDDAVTAKCPNVAAWQTKMAQAHPALTSEGIERDNKAAGFADPDLRDELRKRVDQDQSARNAWIAAPQDKAAFQAMDKVDKDNLAWMKETFAKKGFPHANAVGLAGVSAAFTLVQHATSDIPFMQSMLPQITARADAGELAKGDVAMLIDRLLRHEGKPQRYGTQYTTTNGRDFASMKMDPVEDPAHLDQRRASMDLMPSADYQCMLSVYYAPAPTPAAK